MFLEIDFIRLYGTGVGPSQDVTNSKHRMEPSHNSQIIQVALATGPSYLLSLSINSKLKNATGTREVTKL